MDDFPRAGDLSSPTWVSIRNKVDEAYKWGTKKESMFRHTGVDISAHTKGHDRWIEMNQDFYIETLPEVAIPDHRLRGPPDSPLSSDEVGACPTCS